MPAGHDESGALVSAAGASPRGVRVGVAGWAAGSSNRGAVEKDEREAISFRLMPEALRRHVRQIMAWSAGGLTAFGEEGRCF